MSGLRRTAALGRSRLTPVVGALVALNVAVFVATISSRASVDFRYGMIPAEVAGGEWYRMLTAAFLHLTPSHLFFNMATLAIVGPAVERTLGAARFGVLYLLAALGGSVASYLLGPFAVEGIGASGAIFGVMGAYFVLARRSRTDTTTVVALIAVNLVIGFVEPGIDWRAHIGGLVVGAAVAAGYAVADRRFPRSAGRAALGVVAATCAALAALAQLPAGHLNL